MLKSIKKLKSKFFPFNIRSNIKSSQCYTQLLTITPEKLNKLLQLNDGVNKLNGLEKEERACDADGLYINIPQAEAGFFPPLFYRSETHQQGSQIGTILIREAYYAIYYSLTQLEYNINEIKDEYADLVFNWSYKLKYGKKDDRIYIEHGWLPRSMFQISPSGTNSLSHVAKEFHHRKVSELRRNDLNRSMANLKLLYSCSIKKSKVKQIQKQVKEPFILFAFQLANDANLQYSNSEFSKYFSKKPEDTLRFSQACIDKLSSYDLPCRVVFKQHPVDKNDINKLNKKKEDVFWDNSIDFTTHEIFSSGLCKLVVTVNSNTIHEAAIWGIPGIALGTLMWVESQSNRPFSKDLEDVVSVMNNNSFDDNMLIYIQHLLEYQWSLNDLQNPLIVEELIRTKGRCMPSKLRSKYGTQI